MIAARAGNLFIGEIASRILHRVDTNPPFAKSVVNTTQTSNTIDIQTSNDRVFIHQYNGSTSVSTIVAAPINGVEANSTNVSNMVSSSTNRGFGVSGNLLVYHSGSNAIGRRVLGTATDVATGSIQVSFARGTTFNATDIYWVADNNAIFRANMADQEDVGVVVASLSADSIFDAVQTPSFIAYALDVATPSIEVLNKSSGGVYTAVSDLDPENLTSATFAAMAATDDRLYFGVNAANLVRIYSAPMTGVGPTTTVYKAAVAGPMRIRDLAVDGPFLYWVESDSNGRRLLRLEQTPPPE